MYAVAIALLTYALAPQEALTFEAWAKVHTKSIESVDFGYDFDRERRRDYSFVVSGSQDGTAIIWNAGGTVRHKLQHYKGDGLTAKTPVNQVRSRPGGRVVAVAGADGRITLWDTRTGAFLRELTGHTGRVWDIAWSAEGRVLASCCDDGMAFVWNTDTGQGRKLAIDPKDKVLSALSVSPDGGRVIVGSRNNVLYILDASSGALTSKVNDLQEEPRAISHSPDGRWLAIAEKKDIVIRDAQSGAKVRAFASQDQVTSVRWSHDGSRLFTGGDGGWVIERSVGDGKVLSQAEVRQYVNDIALCRFSGVERLALAKPSGVVEFQK